MQLQEYINDGVEKDIKNLYDHAKIANEEMAVIKTDISWIKMILEKVDLRTWFILSGVILSILVQITFLIKK